jgi:hypothetical protein
MRTWKLVIALLLVVLTANLALAQSNWTSTVYQTYPDGWSYWTTAGSWSAGLPINPTFADDCDFEAVADFFAWECRGFR